MKVFENCAQFKESHRIPDFSAQLSPNKQIQKIKSRPIVMIFRLDIMITASGCIWIYFFSQLVFWRKSMFRKVFWVAIATLVMGATQVEASILGSFQNPLNGNDPIERVIAAIQVADGVDLT